MLNNVRTFFTCYSCHPSWLSVSSCCCCVFFHDVVSDVLTMYKTEKNQHTSTSASISKHSHVHLWFIIVRQFSYANLVLVGECFCLREVCRAFRVSIATIAKDNVMESEEKDRKEIRQNWNLYSHVAPWESSIMSLQMSVDFSRICWAFLALSSLFFYADDESFDENFIRSHHAVDRVAGRITWERTRWAIVTLCFFLLRTGAVKLLMSEKWGRSTKRKK